MEVPKFKRGESITTYMRRVEEYQVLVIQEKYDLLLDFVNEWLNLKDDDKITALTQFMKISEKSLLSDAKRNRDTLRKFSDKIIEKLNPDFSVDDETASDEIDDKYIIHFFRRSCVAINYKLVSFTIRNKTFYSVKKN